MTKGMKQVNKPSLLLVDARQTISLPAKMSTRDPNVRVSWYGHKGVH